MTPALIAAFLLGLIGGVFLGYAVGVTEVIVKMEEETDDD